MKISHTMRRINEIYDALQAGDHLEDYEVIAALEFFALTEGRLALLGPKFALATNECARVANKLNEMHKSRMQKR